MITVQTVDSPTVSGPQPVLPELRSAVVGKRHPSPCRRRHSDRLRRVAAPGRRRVQGELAGRPHPDHAGRRRDHGRAGVLSTFGLLATQRVLVELFERRPDAGPGPGSAARAGHPGAVTAVRAGLGIATGFAQNGLTPLVDREVQRRLFETTTAVRLDAFDQDAFADDMERAWRGCESTTPGVQAAMNLLAGIVGVLAVAAAVVVIHPLLLLALLVATVPHLGRAAGRAPAVPRPTSPAPCADGDCGCCNDSWPSGSPPPNCAATGCAAFLLGPVRPGDGRRDDDPAAAGPPGHHHHERRLR